MSKELYIAAHEEAVDEYMEAHPEATEEEAHQKTANAAYERMVQKYAALIDQVMDKDK